MGDDYRAGIPTGSGLHARMVEWADGLVDDLLDVGSPRCVDPFPVTAASFAAYRNALRRVDPWAGAVLDFHASEVEREFRRPLFDYRRTMTSASALTSGDR